MKSKKTTVAITLFYVCALLLLASCKVSRNESILITVPVESGTTRLKPAGAIRVMGFTRLDVSATEGIGRFRGISKVLFDEDRIIVFDNVSDFQNIWLLTPRPVP
ncbi:MAG: hypothetical protein IPM81_20140 [Saprospirales bacterium]|nr:hypothetical protein [Saprospirales bacterium]